MKTRKKKKDTRIYNSQERKKYDSFDAQKFAYGFHRSQFLFSG